MNLRILLSSLLCIFIFGRCEIIDEKAQDNTKDDAYWDALKVEIKINDRLISKYIDIDKRYDKMLEKIKSFDEEERLVAQKEINIRRTSEMIKLLTYKEFRNKNIFDKKWREVVQKNRSVEVKQKIFEQENRSTNLEKKLLEKEERSQNLEQKKLEQKRRIQERNALKEQKRLKK